MEATHVGKMPICDSCKMPTPSPQRFAGLTLCPKCNDETETVEIEPQSVQVFPDEILPEGARIAE